VPSLKDIRNRINAVRQTRKITSAMKLVAGAKLRRAQEQAEAARPFARRMGEMLGNLAAGVRDLPEAPRLLSGTGEEKKQLLVVVTADRGLCGAFNSQIVRAARRWIHEQRAAGRQVFLYCVGRKGRDMLRREFGDLIVEAKIGVTGKRRIEFTDAEAIAEDLIRRFEDGAFDVCTLLFNTFRTVMRQEVTFRRLIPVETPERPEKEGGEPRPVWEFEPEPGIILNELLPRNLAVQIYGALLENAAGEQGARMTAMDSATRNAGEMIEKLTLHYNRTRQAMITKEIIEIVSGAEALR